MCPFYCFSSRHLTYESGDSVFASALHSCSYVAQECCKYRVSKCDGNSVHAAETSLCAHNDDDFPPSPSCVEHSWSHATVNCPERYIYTGCLQMNDEGSKVNKKFISHLTRAKRTPSAAETLQVSHALPAVLSLVLTAGLRDQFTRWRRSKKRLSVCSVLRCPNLWLQCSVSFVYGLEKTYAWETWTFAATESIGCARVRWEINFLLTFETAPFFCEYPVYIYIHTYIRI